MRASKRLKELDTFINDADDENAVYAAEQEVLGALPAFIAIVEAVEDLQVYSQLGEREDWEGEVYTARYRALHALTNLEMALEVEDD